MNFHDSERMAGLLEREGYEPRRRRARRRPRRRQHLQRARARGGQALLAPRRDPRGDGRARGRAPIVAVTGCVAQQEGAGAPHAATRHRRRRRHAEPQAAAARSSTQRASDAAPQHRHQSARRRLVSAGRGAALGSGARVGHDHRRLQRVLRVLRRAVHARSRADAARRPTSSPRCAQAADSGRREVQLLGQIVNHYQAPDDPACDFAELLRARAARSPGIARIRFASPHPRHVTDRLIDAIRDLPKVCKHLHLPVQSGSNRVLQAMRRRYTRESYLDLVDRLRADVPGIALSTDIIVGFPGETDEDFELTLDLVRRVRYPRDVLVQVLAAARTRSPIKRLPDDVPEAEKTRADRRAAGAAARHSDGAGIGRRSAGPSRSWSTRSSKRRGWELAGRTTGNTVVNFPGRRDWIGRLVPVRITEPRRTACAARRSSRPPVWRCGHAH